MIESRSAVPFSATPWPMNVQCSSPWPDGRTTPRQPRAFLFGLMTLTALVSSVESGGTAAAPRRRLLPANGSWSSRCHATSTWRRFFLFLSFWCLARPWRRRIARPICCRRPSSAPSRRTKLNGVHRCASVGLASLGCGGDGIFRRAVGSCRLGCGALDPYAALVRQSAIETGTPIPPRCSTTARRDRWSPALPQVAAWPAFGMVPDRCTRAASLPRRPHVRPVYAARRNPDPAWVVLVR